VSAVEPSGAFYYMIGVQGYENGRELASDIYKTQNIGVAPGEAFGKGAEGKIRVCFASSNSKVENFLTKFVRFSKAL